MLDFSKTYTGDAMRRDHHPAASLFLPERKP
jgi:hypothetical protein